MSSENLRVIGSRVRKIDGYELVTGRARYTGDMSFPGMLHAYAARSPVSAGILRRIDTATAAAMEGVVRVLTAADIPGPNLIGILPPFDQPVLAASCVRYIGESLALVVADTRENAKRAARVVAADIEALEPILTIDEALKEGARKIHESGNVTYSKKLVKGDAAAGFAGADVVIEGVYETSNQEHAYIEPEVVCAVPGGDGRVTLYASCQSPFHIRGHVANNLALPTSRVKVVQAYTGGSFGGKDDVATEIGTLACVAALKLGKPVMIAHEREESIIGSNLRHASRIHLRTGARNDGTITAREIRILLDGGAYASESPFVTMKALIHAAGPYSIPNLSIESTTVYTNKIYCGAFRGFGVPQVTFASESQIDELADRLGMDRLALRLRNALGPGDTNATGQAYAESVGLRETIGIVKSRMELVPPLRGRHGRWLYGSGIACMLQGISNGAEGIDVSGAHVQVCQDGSAIVAAGITELGQGSRTVFAQIVSEVLGIPLDRVTVQQVDTDSVHDSGPTVASRGSTVGGQAVRLAAEEVRKSLVSMAALMFKADESLIALEEGFARLTVAPDARIPLKDVATAAYWTGFPLMHLAFHRPKPSSFDHETHQGDVYIAYSYGTHLMDIRVDSLTGRVEVLRHLASHDVGKVVNPLGLEGQVEGASLIGFGLAHMEEILWSRGRIVNPNFADYALPSILDRLPTEVLPVEDPSPAGPFGAKGVGEPPVAAAAAVFANAVADATGIRFHRLPITRQDILAAIRASTDGEPSSQARMANRETREGASLSGLSLSGLSLSGLSGRP